MCVCVCRTLIISFLITRSARAAGGSERCLQAGDEPEEGLLSLPGTPRPSHTLSDLIPSLCKEQHLLNSGCTKSKMPPSLPLSVSHTLSSSPNHCKDFIGFLDLLINGLQNTLQHSAQQEKLTAVNAAEAALTSLPSSPSDSPKS